MSLHSHETVTVCGITKRSGMSHRIGGLQGMQERDTGFSGKMGGEGEE